MKSANAETATKEEVTATLATLRVDDATSAIFAAAEKDDLLLLIPFSFLGDHSRGMASLWQW